MGFGIVIVIGNFVRIKAAVGNAAVLGQAVGKSVQFLGGDSECEAGPAGPVIIVRRAGAGGLAALNITAEPIGQGLDALNRLVVFQRFHGKFRIADDFPFRLSRRLLGRPGAGRFAGLRHRRVCVKFAGRFRAYFVNVLGKGAVIVRFGAF